MHKTPHRKALGALNANSSSPFPTLQQAHQKLSKRYNPYPSPCTSTTAKSSPVSLYRSALLDLVIGPDDVVLVGRKAPSAAELARHGCNRYHLLSGRALVSRTHAIIRPRSMTVLGQNGIRVDGQHVGKGETVDLPSDRSMLEVDFHDATLLVHLAPLHPVKTDQDTPAGTPPPLETSDVEMEVEDSLHSSDLSEAEDAEEEEEPAEAESAGQKELHVESPLTLGDVDLVGLIASTLVFSTRTTMTTSEIMRSLIPSLPSLNLSITLAALHRGPFESTDTSANVKDASGKPVEPHWWYSPAMERDAARRESLAPFVKQVRKAQAVRKQYFWAKVR